MTKEEWFGFVRAQWETKSFDDYGWVVNQLYELEQRAEKAEACVAAYEQIEANAYGHMYQGPCSIDELICQLQAIKGVKICGVPCKYIGMKSKTCKCTK